MASVRTFGPGLDEYKEIARQSVMDYYVGIAMQDSRPPTQRAMDVYKVAEARAVMAGGTSNLIMSEAALRGIPPMAMAQAVLFEGRKSEELELTRVRVSLLIDSARTAEEVAQAMVDNKIPM